MTVLEAASKVDEQSQGWLPVNLFLTEYTPWNHLNLLCPPQRTISMRHLFHRATMLPLPGSIERKKDDDDDDGDNDDNNSKCHLLQQNAVPGSKPITSHCITELLKEMY